MTLPRALRYAREGIDYRAPSAALGIYANGLPDTYRDVTDSMRGHRTVDQSTVAASVQAIAQAAAAPHRRRG